MISRRLEAAEIQANDMLENNGVPFNEETLDLIYLPETHYETAVDGSVVKWSVSGSLDAETIVLSHVPWSVQLEDPSQQVRLYAQQKAAGDDVCIVGYQTYDPVNAPLGKSQRKAVKSGSFLPYVERALTVIEHLNLKDDQKLGLYGFSMGADVSAELAYFMTTDPNKGIAEVYGLSAIEAARSIQRGRLAVGLAFGASGKDLYDNVLYANSPALLEARGIDDTDKKAEKKHEMAVNRGVAKYVTQDIRGNLANLSGFSTDMTLARLNQMIDLGILPRTVGGRALDSTVCPPSFLENIRPSNNFWGFEFEGDHSVADNVRKSAAFMVLSLGHWSGDNLRA